MDIPGTNADAPECLRMWTTRLPDSENRACVCRTCHWRDHISNNTAAILSQIKCFRSHFAKVNSCTNPTLTDEYSKPSSSTREQSVNRHASCQIVCGASEQRWNNLNPFEDFCPRTKAITALYVFPRTKAMTVLYLALTVPHASDSLDSSSADALPGARDAGGAGARFGFRVPHFAVSGSGFRVLIFGFWVPGFRVPIFGFRVLFFGFPFPTFGFRVSGAGVPDSAFRGFGFRGFRLRDFGSRVSGFGFRVSGSGFRVSNFGFLKTPRGTRR